MRLVDYYAHYKSKTWGAKTEIRKSRLLLKVWRHFSRVQTSSSNWGVLAGNELKHTPGKSCLQNKRNKSSVEDIEIANLDKLEVASFQKKRAKRERLTAYTNILIRSAKKLSYGSCLQYDSDTSAAKPREAADDVKKMTKEANEASKDATDYREEQSWPLAYSNFDHHYSAKLLTSYSKRSMAYDAVSRS